MKHRIVTEMSGYGFRLTFRSLSDVPYSDKCQTKKAFQSVKRMLQLSRALVKFCSTNRLFKNLPTETDKDVNLPTEA